MKFSCAVVGALAAASCATAFVVPGAAIVRQHTRSSATVVNAGGKYDGKLWDDGERKTNTQRDRQTERAMWCSAWVGCCAAAVATICLCEKMHDPS